MADKGKGQSRKWLILVAVIWIQAFTGTNFDFSAYSSDLKSVVGISQVKLNYLATASDLGKALGWSSGLALLYFPLWTVLFMAVLMGFVGYGVQWLIIRSLISLPYFLVFLSCLLAGCSICWFSTVCFVLCIRNFPKNRALALSLTVGFNGISPALYTILTKAISSTDDSLYLILNALVPLIISIAALIPILNQSPQQPESKDIVPHDFLIFLILNILAIITGFPLLILSSISSIASTPWPLVTAAIFLVLPFCVPGIVLARDHRPLVNDLELHKVQIEDNDCMGNDNKANDDARHGVEPSGGCRLAMLGEEHSAQVLLSRWDFWLYYVVYLCGGTIGLVYGNNLGQIAQSLGYSSKTTTTLVTLYSSCSFFGRLLSAAPDFMPRKVYFARTGWLTIALLPNTIALFLLAALSGGAALHIGTALIGLSSGFIFAAAVSITSELFGSNSVGVNHNLLVTNIPIGSLLYGLLAALVYDANVSSNFGDSGIGSDEAMECMGRKCYLRTFVWWGILSLLGLASSLLLFLRTKPAYNRFEQNRITSQVY